MQRFDLTYATDYTATTLTHATLDYGASIGPNGEPGVIPVRIVTASPTASGAETVGATQPPGTGLPSFTQGNVNSLSPTWAAHGAYGIATQVGDTLSFTTTAYQVAIQLTGVLGAAPTVARVDPAPAQYGPVTGAGLHATEIRNGGVATITRDGTVIAQLDTYRAAPLFTDYLDGTSHSYVITYTGNDISVSGPDTTMLAIESIAFGTGSGGGGTSTLTSPVYDTGDSATQPVVAEWAQSTPLLSVSIATGQTPLPDASWSTMTLPASALTSAQLLDGTTHACAGCLGVPRGRYAQITYTLAGAATVSPWLRAPRLYTWTPERDTFATRMVFGQNLSVGPRLHAVAAALATAAYDVRREVLDLLAAGALGTSSGLYLANHLADLGLERVTSEQPETARARGRAVLSTAGLTLSALIQEMAALVTGSAGPVSITGSAGSLVATCNGIILTQHSSNTFSYTIPGPYLGMPGLDTMTARSIITTHATVTMRPVASTVTTTFI